VGVIRKKKGEKKQDKNRIGILTKVGGRKGIRPVKK